MEQRITENIKANLNRERALAGRTQEEVADAAGLSRAAYRRIEAGLSEPRASTLVALAQALNVKPADLLRPTPPTPRARFRSLKRLNERELLLQVVARQLDDYAGLEEELGARVPYALKNLDLGSETTVGRPIRAARAVRNHLGLNDREPVQNIARLLEDKAGIKVLRLFVATDAFFGLSIEDGGFGPAVVVNTWPRISVERWIFTAAHELGHLVLHRGDYDPIETKESQESEREANVFAGYFLMPGEAFDEEWERSSGMGFYDRVISIKRVFGVSYKTVLYRLQEGDIPNVWLRFQMDAKTRTGKTLAKSDEPEALDENEFGFGNPEPKRGWEPGSLPQEEFVPDRRSRLVRLAVERGLISLGRAAEILRMPLREMKTLRSSWI